MALELSGIDVPVTGGIVQITISNEHPLVCLANKLPWDQMTKLILPDLEATTAAGKWHLGRKLPVRVHLGAYLMQQSKNLTDREAEYAIKDNAGFRLLCGSQSVPGWRAPDHTKIQQFRSRLSPATQAALANVVTTSAIALGYADPSQIDIDSTVQEANIAYPSDANMMLSLAKKAKKLLTYIGSVALASLPKNLGIDMGAISKAAQKYFFMAKNTVEEKRRATFSALHQLVDGAKLPEALPRGISQCQRLS